MPRARLAAALAVAAALLAAAPSAPSGGQRSCRPTRADALGPFYVPGAPVRARVGAGHVLSGFVRASRTCRPLARARVELWLAGPDGRYDAAHRATVFSRRNGGYRFQSNFPGRYGGRPPHFHNRVSKRGFRTLVTQYYPRPGSTRGRFDLVLVPARRGT